MIVGNGSLIEAEGFLMSQKSGFGFEDGEGGLRLLDPPNLMTFLCLEG